MTAPLPAEPPAAGESFEALYARLEVIAGRLEAGQLSLDESLALYDEGMQLAQRCQERLAQVEQRIETLREAYDDSFGGPGR